MKLETIALSAGLTLFGISSTYASTLYADRILERISIDFKNQEVTKTLTPGEGAIIKISDIFTQKDELRYEIINASNDLQFKHYENDRLEILTDNNEGEYQINMQICSPSQIEATHEQFDLIHGVEIEDEE